MKEKVKKSHIFKPSEFLERLGYSEVDYIEVHNNGGTMVNSFEIKIGGRKLSSIAAGIHHCSSECPS